MQIERADILLRWELSVFLVNGHMQQQTLWSFPDVSALAELTTDNDIWLQCSAALTAPPRTLRAEETLKIWNISPLCLPRLPLSPRLSLSLTFVNKCVLLLSPLLLFFHPLFSTLSSPCVSSFVSSLVSLCFLPPPFVSSLYFSSARLCFYLLLFCPSFFPFFSSLDSFCLLSPHFSFVSFISFCFFSSPRVSFFSLLSPFLSPPVPSLLFPSVSSFLLFFPLCFLFVFSLLSLCLFFFPSISSLVSFCVLPPLPLPPLSSFHHLSSPPSSPQVSEATVKQKPKTEFCFGEFIRGGGATLSHAHAAGHSGVNFILSMWLNVIMWLLWKFMESISISAVINAVSRRYFLQANDATDMSEWVAALNKASKITVSAAHTCSDADRWIDLTLLKKQKYRTRCITNVEKSKSLRPPRKSMIFFLHNQSLRIQRRLKKTQ